MAIILDYSTLSCRVNKVFEEGLRSASSKPQPALFEGHHQPGH
jgi:hypothetical protein